MRSKNIRMARRLLLTLLLMGGVVFSAVACKAEDNATAPNNSAEQASIAAEAKAEAKDDASDRKAMEQLSIRTQDGALQHFYIEVAMDMRSQIRGLMYRKSMPADQGMLFVFPDVAERSFWMKNTYIPLDMLFIDASGKIINIHENAVPEDLTPIYSSGPAKYVLEINGGESKKLGIRAGDRLVHKIFGNVEDSANK